MTQPAYTLLLGASMAVFASGIWLSARRASGERRGELRRAAVVEALIAVGFGVAAFTIFSGRSLELPSPLVLFAVGFAALSLGLLAFQLVRGWGAARVQH